MSTRASGRPAAFDEIELLDAAVRVLDRDGLPALTLASAAGELGVTAMALYRVVDSKADLLARIPDHLLAGIDVRVLAVGGGISSLREAAEHVVEVLEAHPAAVPLFAQPAVGPHMAEVGAHCVSQLVIDGCAGDRAGAILRATFALVFGLAAGGGETALEQFGPVATDAIEIWFAGVAREMGVS